MTEIGKLLYVQDTAHQGADYVRTMRLSDSNGNPKDFSGYDCQVEWRTAPNEKAALSQRVGSGITITAASGQIEIRATQAQLEKMRPAKYRYDVLLKSGAGTYTHLVTVDVRLAARRTKWSA